MQDLSFYLGFTRIGPWTLDLGPCFGMNGHFRRDPDVISRLSKSTIDFRFLRFGLCTSFLGFRFGRFRVSSFGLVSRLSCNATKSTKQYGYLSSLLQKMAPTWLELDFNMAQTPMQKSINILLAFGIGFLIWWAEMEPSCHQNVSQIDVNFGSRF